MRATLATIAAIAVLASAAPAGATCSCMFRRRPPPTVTQDSTITDPAYNPASAVFVTREGTRTVLTMETVYSGPPDELSMLIPVPTSLERDQVRTISGTVFRNLDRRTSPRVRHVWPACRRARQRRPMRMAASAGGGGGAMPERQRVQEEYGVDIEDEWEVDEYDITLLGAEQSTGLLAFLHERRLDLKQNAVPVLRAYIESDHRFVLARVDPSRANVLEGKMMLSPIQLEYESEDLRVPVRLGTLNSPGEQELLLYVLSDDGRFEVANRPMVTAPTDLRMRSDVRGGVAQAYASLTDEIFRQTPGAAVTEFAHTLGRRVGRYHVRELGIPEEREQGRRWTLTRMRHRYGVDLDDDLTLRPAAEPLRQERRWSHPELRVWGPRGESAFHVQFAVIHGSSCPSTAVQRRYAQRWATAESMWDLDEHVWPGEVFLDPIESLGIEPDSSAPEGWPPPPPEPPPPSPLVEDPSAIGEDGAPEAPPADLIPEEPPDEDDDAADPEEEEESGGFGFCAVSPARRGAPWVGAFVALIWGVRRRIREPAPRR